MQRCSPKAAKNENYPEPPLQKKGPSGPSRCKGAARKQRKAEISPNLCRKKAPQAFPSAKVQSGKERDLQEVRTCGAPAPDGSKPPDGVAARGSVSGRGPRAKRRGRDSPKGLPLRRHAAAGARTPNLCRKMATQTTPSAKVQPKSCEKPEFRRTFAENRALRPFQVQRCSPKATKSENSAEPLQKNGHSGHSKCKGAAQKLRKAGIPPNLCRKSGPEAVPSAKVQPEWEGESLNKTGMRCDSPGKTGMGGYSPGKMEKDRSNKQWHVTGAGTAGIVH